MSLAETGPSESGLSDFTQIGDVVLSTLLDLLPQVYLLDLSRLLVTRLLTPSGIIHVTNGDRNEICRVIFGRLMLRRVFT